MMEKLDSTLSNVIGKLSDLVQAHANDAIMLAGSIAMWGNRYILILTGVLFMSSCIFTVCAFKALRRALELWAEYDERLCKTKENIKIYSAACIANIITLILSIGSLFSVIAFLCVFFQSLSPLLWASAFDPKVALAAKLMENILK